MLAALVRCLRARGQGEAPATAGGVAGAIAIVTCGSRWRWPMEYEVHHGSHQIKSVHQRGWQRESKHLVSGEQRRGTRPDLRRKCGRTPDVPAQQGGRWTVRAGAGDTCECCQCLWRSSATVRPEGAMNRPWPGMRGRGRFSSARHLVTGLAGGFPLFEGKSITAALRVIVDQAAGIEGVYLDPVDRVGASRRRERRQPLCRVPVALGAVQVVPSQCLALMRIRPTR